MAPEPSRLVRQFTFALLMLAAAATEVAAVDTRPVLASVGTAVVWVGLAAFLGWAVPLPADGRRTPPRFVFLILLGLSVAPFVVEPLRRAWTGEGYPLELQMVFVLRNLGLGLAAFAAWLLCLRLACVVSLFLMLFAVTMTEHRAVMILLGLYSATGSVWLMLVYWTGLRRFFVASDTAVALEVRPGRGRLPWLAVFVAVGVVGCVLGLIAVGPQRTARTLAEWLPTSGGTGGYDPFARGGINDGDDQVRGNNPRGTGMVDTDQFLDSPLPTLYDIANDLYGEPFKPKEHERAIALDGQTKVRESEKPPPDNQRPNREFPTARKGPTHPRDPSDRAARALFEVEGRTPLHVRVTAFDDFDGAGWQEAPLSQNTCLLEKEQDSCWMNVQERQPTPVFAENEGHKFKITSSFGSLVPTPPHLVRFPVGRVDRANFFAWGIEPVVQRVTAVFGLARFIGSSAEATVFQASYCLVLYDVIRVVQRYVAAAGSCGAEEVSTRKLFVDVHEELLATCKLVPTAELVGLVDGAGAAADGAERLRGLLGTAWRPRYRKARDRKPRPPRPRAKQSGAHTAVYRLQQQHRASHRKKT
jgi:hypothetical protein